MMHAFRQHLSSATRVLGGSKASPTPAGASTVARHVVSPLNARRLLLRATVLLGRTGVAGIGLLVACSVFYFSTIQQTQEQLSATRKNIQVLQGQLKRGGHADQRSSEERFVRFYDSFPRNRDLPRCMEEIFALAQSQGIDLDQGEYKVTRDSSNGLVRFQMSFPVNADYPRIRKYLASLMADIPTLSLQQVKFKREKVGDAVVEADISLVLFLLEKKS